ncbi:MAG: hypothetical protein GQ570_12980 [Helicobacteraceae bacterium]|nr:hypothetical protein [Helicobacteraceae bacterium]
MLEDSPSIEDIHKFEEEFNQAILNFQKFNSEETRLIMKSKQKKLAYLLSQLSKKMDIEFSSIEKDINDSEHEILFEKIKTSLKEQYKESK